MIFALPPQPQFEIQYRPSYLEIADESVQNRYRTTDGEVIRSREGSAYLKGLVATSLLRKKLHELANCDKNSMMPGEDPPSQHAIGAAGHVLRSFLSSHLIPDGVLASAEGGVAICFVRGDKYADIECLNSGEVLAVTSTRNKHPHAWALRDISIDSESAAQIISSYLSL